MTNSHICKHNTIDVDTPCEYEIERDCYFGIADELSGDPNFMNEVDPLYAELAKHYSELHELPWPPPAIDQGINIQIYHGFG
jgi:hypothetical protein